ncbi:MAG: hypothetical protein COW01_13930 [Bdellovibrionales bacterium CG12_big_fil_rev_8_21_14_0_65_38_15]|nr:MAG: hypothetical protein COW79_16750 [Bdellovibrionales bacterium CG22_combo_CG10-13_8_21_14_all_38_13]PIQ53371.1 MAG: hypothetical protein COW01_13930 [Bdellovibrionales bacterium CG12_big_fil_rev_8_21_14_0_65_38_15]PIR30266.1 MAG: hypothetical protein COV38_05825 [Bdellovibrionales bacterium CG11_big_fil_rev_8_21_14_0_20_38_13]
MRLLVILCTLMLTSSAFGSWGEPETDLSGSSEKRILFSSNFVMPDQVESSVSRDGKTSASMVLVKGDEKIILAMPDFNLESKCKNGEESFRVYAKAQTSRFSIQDRDIYEFGFEGKCGHDHRLIYDEKTPAGELAGVWNTAKTAEEKMTDAGIISLWKRNVSIIFPANGDYYSGDRVRVTKGYQWDVVGHELGHAIYDQAKMGSFGGGSHRIDECYSEALALSEGWASYFSAWLKIDRTDADAKFEYMVPRRAPLRIETIPADVCQGPKNEWRVTGFLWDVLDLNDDDEQVDQTFAAIWLATAEKRSRNINQMKDYLISSGMSAEKINALWEKNFFDR